MKEFRIYFNMINHEKGGTQAKQVAVFAYGVRVLDNKHDVHLLDSEGEMVAGMCLRSEVTEVVECEPVTI